LNKYFISKKLFLKLKELIHMAIKQFICNYYNPSYVCSFTLTEDEIILIEDAAAHEIKTHQEEDTPELREKIQTSLIDPDVVFPNQKNT
jgi:hypothetical protein